MTYEGSSIVCPAYHIYTHTHACSYKYAHRNIYTHAHTIMLMHTYTHTHAHTHIHTHAHSHTCSHMLISTHTHTHTHAHLVCCHWRTLPTAIAESCRSSFCTSVRARSNFLLRPCLSISLTDTRACIALESLCASYAQTWRETGNIKKKGRGMVEMKMQ